MKPYLLDVNLLVALSWPAHEHHDVASRWFGLRQPNAFATCPFTQAGLVRILSNPAAVPGAVSPAAAARLLEHIVAMAGHQFWPDDIPVSTVVSTRPAVTGHKQILDAYLIEQAKKRGGIFATLDRAVVSLSGGEKHLVELVDAR